MGGLIWIIVIVVVISEIKKFQRKNGQRVKPNVPRQQQYMRPDQTKVGQQNVRPNQMPRQQQNVRPNQMPRQQQGMRPNQMAGQQNVRPNQMAGHAPEPDAGTADAECRRGCHGRLPQTAA